jgi:hypothetical protein
MRRKYDKLASNLLFLAFILGSLVDFYTKTGIFSPGFHTPHISASALAVIMAILLVLILLQYYYIRLGYRWAKILFILLFAFSLLMTATHLEATFAKQLISPLKATSFFAQWALQLAATILLLLDWKRPHESQILPASTTSA